MVLSMQNSYFYDLDHLFSTPMPQDLPRLPVVNPKYIDLSMVASTDHGPPHFHKYTTFHKLSTCVDCKCFCRCGAIGEVEIKSGAHIVDKNASTWSTDIDVSAKWIQEHHATQVGMATHIADLSGEYFSVAVSVSLQTLQSLCQRLLMDSNE